MQILERSFGRQDVFYHLVQSYFSFSFAWSFLFSTSLARIYVPPSHVAVSGFRRILLRSLSLSLSEASIRFGLTTTTGRFG